MSRKVRTSRDQRRRELSQNFLTRTGAKKFLANISTPTEGTVLEVGAGSGALTFELTKRFDRVVAFEKDQRLASRMQERTELPENLVIVPGDVLVSRPPELSFTLVGNIPFSVTSKVVNWGLSAERMELATLLVQLEYAKKRAGGFGRWSLQTVMTWPTFHWSIGSRISRELFRPVPRTDAAVLHIRRRPERALPMETAEDFKRFVETGFSGVGGSLYASLSRHYPSRLVKRAFAECGINRGTVVAFVHPDQWLDLYRTIRM